MRKLALVMACFIVVLSLLGNYLYYQSKQLSQPIMLKHYYEIRSDEDMFELHYLTNKNGTNDIQSISIPEMDGYSFYNEDGSCKNYKYYCLKTISVHINKNDIKDQLKKDIYFDKVRAKLKNGKIVTYSIGEISIVDDSHPKLPIEFLSSASSSDNTGEQIIQAKEPLSIQSIQIPFTTALKDSLDFYVITDQGTLKKVHKEMTVGHWDDQKIAEWKNGKDRLVKEEIFPLPLQKDDYLDMKYQFTFGNRENGNDFYQLAVNVKGTTKKGKEISFPIWMNYSPYFSQKGIDEIVKQRREIDHGKGNK